jgi:hypothetical protein
MGVDDLRDLYRDFNDIYNRHVDDAKLDTVKKAEFRSLKERLITVRHLLEKYPELAPGERTELIQAVLSDNLQRAQQIFLKSDTNNQLTVWSKIARFLSFSRSKETESPRTDPAVKMNTSNVSDSKFLLQLKGVDDKDLEAAIQAAKNLASDQLSSSIDTVVKKMAEEVLRMQQGECKRSLKRESETKERKELGDILVNFIQAINRASAGRRTS